MTERGEASRVLGDVGLYADDGKRDALFDDDSTMNGHEAPPDSVDDVLILSHFLTQASGRKFVLKMLARTFVL